MRNFLSELIKKDIHIDLVEGELSVKFPKNRMDRMVLEEIKSKKQAIITYLNNLKENIFTVIPVIPKANYYDISNAQRRLWLLSQFEGSSVAYNVSGNIYLNQDIDIECFKKAIDSTIERHEILRTVFKEDVTGEVKQWILGREDLGFKIDYKDFRKDQNKEEQAQSYIREDSYKAYDLTKGPLLRAALLQVEETEYIFYFNMHHIISDGWSMEVLRKDVFSYYEAYKEKKEPVLKELRIQYKDYAAWQLSQIEEESFKAHRTYWLDNLKGELPLLDIPSSKQRPRIKTYYGHCLSTYIDRVTSEKLKGYLEAHGGSLFMGLLAVWNILMYRYTSSKDIIIGTPIAGREHIDLEDQIGFYINTLALRNEIKGEESFNEFYGRLKENTLKNYNHQMYPFDRLVEELDLARDISRNAVFDVMLVLQNNGEKRGLDPIMNGLKEQDPIAIGLNKIIDLGYSTSKFDIEITFQEAGNYLLLQTTFNRDVYEKEMMEGLIVHYKQLLHALLEHPEEKIAQIDYLCQEEKHELLVNFNNTKVDYPTDKTIVELFEEQVVKTPDHIAVAFEEQEWTYSELNEKSNQFAHYLQKHYQIQPDDLVGIKQERSEWMIISILGVLKSGGAYVPIDPKYPQDRIKYIENDTACKVCIEANELNKFKKDQRKYSKKKTAASIKADNLAYVIYTSGSTGNPKGVLLEHSGVINRLLWMERDLGINDKDVFLQKTPITFDVSVWEVFLPLISGSKLVIAKPDGHKDPVYLECVIKDHEVSVIHFVPSMLSGMLESIQWNKFKSLRHVVCSGETLTKKLERSFKEKSMARLYNYYGPTEASVDVTAIDLTRFPTTGNEVSIGKPVDNTSIYIVNQMNELQPIGILGEILIGGIQVARGYLNKEELTKKKFMVSPFKEGERVYKTGDLGRWLPDGNIEFIGRKDNQVKIRGYRIELGEIENALLQHDWINDAAVIVKEDANGDMSLVAYIISEKELNSSTIRMELSKRLPEYMLPAHYVQLDQLPLTLNGKINKKALLDSKGLALSSGEEYLAPRNKIEEQLVELWEEILNKKNIGINDNFFSLGGNSIKIIKMVDTINKTFNKKMTIVLAFRLSNIRALSEYIHTNKKIEPEEPDAYIETSINSMEETLNLYNQDAE
jgi:amino acid adenylation domain-containing protein